jgi:asparagine synthase (glutamine-hydrolysing)
MCGICGIYDPSRPLHLARLIQAMNDRQRHRGPDDAGAVLFDTNRREAVEVHGSRESWTDLPRGCDLAFGHRRLSIIELSEKGHQPMANDDGTKWITYNGEIYNYVELRKELQGLGHKFRTQSDTEVILKSYEEWGSGCLKKFNGMWAFCLCDLRADLLFCARDRFGVKPFYYYLEEPSLFVFASEIPTLLSTRIVPIHVDESMLFKYLVFNLQPLGQDTFYKHLRQLEGGCLMLIQHGRLREYRRWWTPQPENAHPGQEIHEHFRHLFKDAVKLRMRSDVPVGSCLSGGLDSSSIVSMVHHLTGRGLETFTAAYEKASGCDERAYASLITDTTGSKENLVFADAGGFLADLEDLVKVQGEPFQGMSIYAQYCLMRKVREKGIPVVLDGQGGDELFWGYTWYYAFYIRWLLVRLRLIDALSEFRKGVNIREDISLEHMLQANLYYLFPRIRRLRNMARGRNLFNREFMDVQFRNTRESLSDIFGFKRMDKLRAFEILAHPLPALLRYEDRNSMAFGVESRLPFLDYRLVNFALSLRPDQLIKNGWTKRPVREGMKGILPERVRLRRTKLGFSVPDQEWFFRLKPFCLDLFKAPGKSEKYINRKQVLKDFERGSLDPFLGWRIVNLELFLRQVGG